MTLILKIISQFDLKHIFMMLQSGLIKPGEVGDFFALVSMKSPNFCQKVKF